MSDQTRRFKAPSAVLAWRNLTTPEEHRKVKLVIAPKGLAMIVERVPRLA
jgi:hypothetical protein